MITIKIVEKFSTFMICTYYSEEVIVSHILLFQNSTHFNTNCYQFFFIHRYSATLSGLISQPVVFILSSLSTSVRWGRCSHTCGRSGRCLCVRYRGSACRWMCFHFVNHNPGTADQCWYHYHD